MPLTRLSCPFDDISPGVASRGRHSGQPHSASALPEAPKKTQLLPLRCRRLPSGEHARVACRVMPLLKPESTPKTRKAPAAPPQSGWHGERREGSALSQEQPSCVHSCHTSSQPTPALNKKFTVTVQKGSYKHIFSLLEIGSFRNGLCVVINHCV